jgi:methylthioribose-1-phosphate isomerase
VSEGRAVADEDVGRNREMSRWGAEWVLEQVRKREGKTRKVKVLTVCNTGSLATSVRHKASCYTQYPGSDAVTGDRDMAPLSV